MQGILLKQSDHLKLWNPRFFRLEDSRLLFYTEQPRDLNSERPRAIIRVDTCSIPPGLTVLPDTLDLSHKFVFNVALPNGGRNYILASPDRNEAEKWLFALQAASVCFVVSIYHNFSE